MISDSLDRFRNLLNSIRTRFWLIPAVMSLAALVAGRLLVRLPEPNLLQDYDAWWYFRGDAETARDILSTLLSGMITMTSLVISITMVVLSLAANQLGPRLIWNFIRDRQIQSVIGLFFATIFFILIVIRSVGDEDVPQIAVTAATALVGLCLFALLFHVHKVARSIVADTVVQEVSDSLLRAIEALPPAEEAAESDAFIPVEPPLERRTSVSAGRAGYVQLVEHEHLVRLGRAHNLCFEVLVRAGHFVTREGAEVIVRHQRDLDAGLIGEIRAGLLVGQERTPTQDVEYSVRQLVEVAVRALSPGINDPFTAIAAVNQLGRAVESLMGRRLPGRHHFDEAGVLRVVAEVSRFDGIVDVAFNQIRQAAAQRADVAVLIAMVRVLGLLSAAVAEPAQATVLRRHLAMLDRAGSHAVGDPSDRADFDAAVVEAARRLGGRGPEDETERG